MRAPNPDFWRNRRVLLTGHTGFKGTWAAAWLSEMGADVTGLALDPPTSPSLFQTAGIAEVLEDHRLDIRDAGRLGEKLAQARPEIVLHFAAQSLVKASYAEPVVTYDTNVMGTVNLLEAVRSVDSVRALVCITSDKCYRNREWEWPYRETDELGGHDPYSNSKACQELVVSAYRDSYLREAGVSVGTGRAGNVIGGGDWADDRLVPDLVRSFMGNRPALIRNPLAVRPWQHVLEPLSGYLLLAEKLHAEGEAWADSWNFGPNESDIRQVSWIADRATALWGGQAEWHQDSAQHPHEAHTLRLDWSRARVRLRWHPAWDLDTALARTIQLYQLLAAAPDAADVRRAMRSDIEDWCGAIKPLSL